MNKPHYLEVSVTEILLWRQRYEVKQLLMVTCQTTINKVIVSAVIYLEKVKLGVIYASWKSPICLFSFFPLSFQSDVIVGMFDPETTALNSNKQQDGTKVELPSVFTL